MFFHTPGRIKGDDTGDVACDHYHRWAEDIEWLARGGFNAYRFSTAWPRILPSGAGVVEHRGLDFYDRLVDGLMARGIAPWLCLYHWDLPQALQDEGGWLKRDIAEKFADYARVVGRRLGDRVKHWAMFNEPNVHALFGYGIGSARAGAHRPRRACSPPPTIRTWRTARAARAAGRAFRAPPRHRDLAAAGTGILGQLGGPPRRRTLRRALERRLSRATAQGHLSRRGRR